MIRDGILGLLLGILAVAGVTTADHAMADAPAAYYGDLCSGTYWGRWSNGVGVTMRFSHRGWNNVDVYVENQGGYVFIGNGRCDQYGDDAYIDFTMEGYGAISYNHGEVHFRRGRSYLTGQQDRSGLYFSLQR